MSYQSDSSNQACASCRHKRSRCRQDCPLARYFPANQPEKFKNAQKLFGVSNILKALEKIPDPLRDDAMTAIIYTANARAKDPVGGCHRIIQCLSAKLAYDIDELRAVRHQLCVLKEAARLQLQAAPPLFLPDRMIDNQIIQDETQNVWMELPFYYDQSTSYLNFSNEDTKAVLHYR